MSEEKSFFRGIIYGMIEIFVLFNLTHIIYHVYNFALN